MDQKKAQSDFITLLTPNYYKIHGFILTMVAHRTDTEDVLQSTIAYMWEHFDDFKQGTNFLSWAFTIAKFQVLTYRNKKNRSIVFYSDKALHLIEQENRKTAHEMDHRLQYLNRCFKKLRDQDISIIKQRYDKSVTVKMMAEELGTSINIVYKRIAKIKKALLRCVQHYIVKGELA